MNEVNTILKDITNKNLKPIYFLMGEEPFYIDKISNFIADKVLTEDEKAFNQVTLYGKDITIEDIESNAKRYPMMADYQVVIVKEAQELIKTIENLTSYAENPQPSTILVICYRYKTLDKRKKLAKAIAKTGGVLFESKKLYENQVPNWISNELKHRGFKASPKVVHLLAEFLGSDLGKINNELDKLEVIFEEGTTITPEHIEQNIGVSKDFNNFELQKAIAHRDYKKAYQIVNYFSQNTKENSILKTVPILYSYFSKVLMYHGLKDKSNKNAASVLGVHPFFMEDYVTAAKNYPMKKISQNIEALREIDGKSKGVNSVSASEGDLYKELLVKIML
ncbi:DNA polymerase III subunit delta [Mesonia sp. K7]|uniref:DNA polymerase III subunit delta n=1 Tax=Mesonia sp. K7 TaxID=2218606 RepID=UPI000DA7F157|nr:DNA polymerase III subunit delta [Mesonia sp. K7]PZD77242.1 DNA polymerase III subunit delta [Mesonia sp. K7]